MVAIALWGVNLSYNPPASRVGRVSAAVRAAGARTADARNAKISARQAHGKRSGVCRGEGGSVGYGREYRDS